MSRFSPEFLDEIRTRLRPSDVIGRKVKLKKRGDAWWGLSPFKEEKTPSFSVSDRRGTYHCFATQKHGNIFDFLMEVERLTFPEAVERLAKEAGVELPQNDPGERERQARKSGLVEACEAAAKFYEDMLRRAPGRAGAEYLKTRGVTEEQIKAFRLGYAPDAGRALKDHLINKGFTEDVLLDAGLIARPEEGGGAYDRFRHRVMFPILGGRDEVIAFGGRALDPEARAKYLNSPETALFHKSDVLYNYGTARGAAAALKKPLIVCEGYMDVIALCGAGFENAVAPLGTALTEHQLALLWRQSDEPLLCFDGDKAGIGAAHRSLERALPMLKPGKSLSYVFLPDGLDPDDVVRRGGAAAFQKALDAALPFAEVLWRREIETRPLDTPERRAALKSGLRDLVQSIADKDVRRAYGEDVARRLDEAFAPPRRDEGAQRRPRADGRRPAGKKGAWQEPPARLSALLRQRGGPSSWGREATLVLAALNHPALIERQEQAFLDLSLENDDLDGLLKAILSAILAGPALDREGLKGHLQSSGAAKPLERVLGDETLNRQSFLRPEAELDEVEKGWSDALRHHLIATQARRAMSESAAQSFTSGEEVWKAAVIHREELINANAGEEKPADADVTSREFEDRLERMRTSVGAKRRSR
ncbi:MAG: DNA primase [Parvularculaceae bacterium]